MIINTTKEPTKNELVETIRRKNIKAIQIIDGLDAATIKELAKLKPDSKLVVILLRV